MFSRCFLPLLLCSLLGAPPSTAHAEEPSSAPPGYAEAINQAIAELEANNLPEAKEEFRRAHAIYPNARTLRGMGMVEFELRNYSVSVRMLEAALASQVKPLEGKLLTETDNLLERARRYLGEVVIKLEPSGAALRVDGVKVREAGALRLEVGQHVIEADAPGYASERREIRIDGGERSEVALSLRSLSDVSSAARVASAESAPADRRTSSEAQPAYRK
ncbi:MAG TPA: hypothetical protein VMF89_28455, partial [Polyangiales bacterium]|nr:hypothetical protein [Polyangiales bacterium]